MKATRLPAALFLAATLPACADSEPPRPPGLQPTPRAAELYPNFPTDGIFPRIEKAEHMPDPASLKQPESLVKAMKAIQTGSLEERLDALRKKSLDDQVFVKGGKFLMGDFGHLQSNEGLPWTSTKSNKPLRKVTLSDYSISKYKVTYAEFDLYTEANGLDKIQNEEWFADSRKPDIPAGVTWEQADAYCRWLGKLTDKSFQLPTEAQWEYAARSRGWFIVWPTDDGTLTWDRNVPSYDLNTRLGDVHARRIALFPANPLGLYDLTKNGTDWIHDWFSEAYYANDAESEDPQGPVSGTKKVKRSWPPEDGSAGMSFDKRSGLPGKPAKLEMNGFVVGGVRTDTGFRCASAN